MEQKKRSLSLKGDKVIWMIFLILCIISILEVFSASSILTYRTGDYLSPVMKHAGLMLVGVFMALVTMRIPCKYFQTFTLLLLVLSFVLLIVALLVSSGTNGANRWLNLGGINFQPSEMAKGALVLAVAQILSFRDKNEFFKYKAFKYILIVSALIIGPIFVENFSTAALLAIVVFLMMIIGKIPWQQLMKIVALGVIVVGAFLAFVFMAPEEEKDAVNENETEIVAQAVPAEKVKEERGFFDKLLHRAPTWKNRIVSFMDQDDIKPEDVDLDADAQWAHSNIAIASSDFIGKGPGNSTERDFLPQAFSDFIFAIIVEEWGFLGAIVVCFLYIFLLFRTASIASKCANSFPALLIMGIALLIVVQAMFNMLVSVGAVPVTGQPLPLISKGGTSSIINCIYIGVIQSVSISAKKKNSEENASLAEA